MSKLNYSKVFVDREELESLEDIIDDLQTELQAFKKENFVAFEYKRGSGMFIGTDIIYFKDEEIGKKFENMSKENAELRNKLYYGKSERGQIAEFNSLPWYKKIFYKFELKEKDE